VEAVETLRFASAASPLDANPFAPDTRPMPGAPVSRQPRKGTRSSSARRPLSTCWWTKPNRVCAARRSCV